MNPTLLEKSVRTRRGTGSAFGLPGEIVAPVADENWIRNELNLLHAEQGTKNFGSVFGQWPGEETDAEVDAFLEEIS